MSDETGMQQCKHIGTDARRNCALNVKADVRVVVILEAQGMLRSLHAWLLHKACTKVMLLETEIQSRLMTSPCTHEHHSTITMVVCKMRSHALDTITQLRDVGTPGQETFPNIYVVRQPQCEPLDSLGSPTTAQLQAKGHSKKGEDRSHCGQCIICQEGRCCLAHMLVTPQDSR